MINWEECRMLVYITASLCSHLLVQEQASASPTVRGVISNILPFVMSQQGRTNPVVWDIAWAIYLIKGDFYFVIHAFFPIILAPTLWFGEKRDGQPRSTSGDCSSPPTLRLSHLSLYLCCMTSFNKPSIQPSDLTWQVAFISTSRITTTREKYTTQSLTNSLEIS